MTKLDNAVNCLDMSLSACAAVLRESKEPLQRRLTWLASELERLAGESYRFADEAGDDPGANPAHSDFDYCICRKAPCTCGSLTQVLVSLPITGSSNPVR